MTNNPDAYDRAKKRVKAKLEFRKHVYVYIGVGVLLAIINLIATPDYLWVKWPLMGWGLAIVLHGISVYFISDGSDIAEEMIRKEMKKEQ